MPGRRRRCCAASLERARAPVAVSARLYATAHGVYAPSSTARGRRPRARARLDELPPPAALPDATTSPTCSRAGANALEALLGDGWFRGRLGFGGRARALRRPAGAARPARGQHAGGERVVGSPPTGQLDRAARAPIARRRPLRRRAHRPAPDGRAAAGPASAVDVARARTRRTLVAPDGPPVRGTEVLARRRASYLAVGRDDRRLRAEPRRPAAPAGARRRGRREVVLPRTPRCSRTASWASGRCAAPRPPTRTCCAGGRRGRVEPRVHVPRLPLRRGHRLPETGRRRREARRRRHRHGRTGWFDVARTRCSNRFHENVVWSMRGNFLDVPTDCPQRDERLGWTGDIQVFAPTAAFLYDTAGFLTSWLADLAAEQQPDGTVPFVVPGRRSAVPARPAAAWGDAADVVPWVLYERFGDREPAAHASYRACAPGSTRSPRWPGRTALWTGGFQFGDWLDPAAPPDDPARPAPTRTWSPPPTSSARPDLARRSAALLGDDDDRRHVRAGRPRSASRVRRASTSPPAGRLAQRRRRPRTRWRCASTCCPAEPARARRRAPRRARPRAAATASAPASSARR